MGQVHCAGPQGAAVGSGDAGSVGDLQVDPIVERGIVPSMHMHEFFGSTEIVSMQHPESATYADLVDTQTTCDVALDSALYWIPLLSYKGGGAVPLARMEAYYFAWNGALTDPAKTTRTLPSDLRVVAGNAMATSRYQMDRTHVYWDCGAFSTKSAYDHHWATPAAADCATAQPIDGGKVLLTLALTFPSCWDGVLNDHTRTGDTADFNGNPMSGIKQHLAYPTSSGCPAAYPRKVMTLRENISWQYAGDGTDVALSSGPGYTAHGDFLNSWDPTALKSLLYHCVDTTLSDAETHTLYPSICGPPIPCPTQCPTSASRQRAENHAHARRGW
jgi:Domain of unknown function (DUF1996)